MADENTGPEQQSVPDHRVATTADLAPITARLDALEKKGKKPAAKKGDKS